MNSTTALKISAGAFAMFRPICIFILMCCLIGKIAAQPNQQVSIVVNVSPPYSPYLNDYLEFRDRTVITVTNRTPTTQKIYLKGLFTNDNNFSAGTVDDYLPTSFFTLGPNATSQIPANNDLYAFFNENNLFLEYGDYDVQDILVDGVIPEGSYRLCVDVFDFDTHEQLNTPGTGCKTFYIAHLNAPMLIAPSCMEGKTIVKNNIQDILFSWTRVSSAGQNIQIRYDLFILKLIDDENSQDAMESAIAQNSRDLILVENLIQPQLNYNFIHPELKLGKYAWAVRARSLNGEYPIVNNGLSTVCEFEMIPGGGNQFDVAQGNLPDCSCKAVLPQNFNQIPANGLSNGAIIRTGHFAMQVTNISRNGDLYSGTGTIPLPLINNSFLKINVRFQDIGIGASGDEYFHTSGVIEAAVDPGAASMLPELNPMNPGQMNFTPAQAQSLSDHFASSAGQVISKIKNYPNTIAYNLPIGMDENVMTVAISKIQFHPEQAAFDAVTVLDIIDGNSKVGLTASNVCIDANDICGEGELFLNQDFNIPVIGLTLLGGFDETATSITFDKEGFKSLRIGAAYTFPAGTLVNAETKAPAVFTISAETEKGWNDWIAEVTHQPFHIVGMDDFIFGAQGEASSIYYDHSDFSNPQNIPSPYKSPDGNEEIATHLPTWRGFYISQIGLTLPAVLANSEGKKIVVKAEKFIFDQGLSGAISINNILSIDKGSLDGWYFSIESFKLHLWKNTFKSSSLNGKVVLPLSNSNGTPNQLDYTCTLSKPANESMQFGFIIQQKNNIDIDIFWAKGNIHSSSLIMLSIVNGKFLAKAILCGDLSLKPEINGFPDIKLAEVKFRDLKFQSAEPFFSPGEMQATLFSLSSPQHSIAGFTIDLNPQEGRGVSLMPMGGGGGKNAEIGLRFGALLKLVANVDFVPKAEINFDVYGKLEMDGIRPKWRGIDARINKIELGAEASIGGIGVHGTLGYYNDNAGSYGFIGSLNMSIVDLLSVGAKAQFGYQKTGDFNYFFIDAMADFKAGIPIPPTMALYGFMGGVYYNMEMAQKNVLENDDIKGDSIYTHDYDNPQPFTTLSGVSYVPAQGKFDIRAGVLFGLKSREILDADGSLTVSINMVTGGMDKLFFKLSGRFISSTKESIADRKKNCMGELEIVMQMNFVEKSFLFFADLELGVPNHSKQTFLGASATVNFYAGKSGWFIHIGRPWTDGGDAWGKNFKGGNPIELTVLGLSFRGYFQCGTGTGDIWDKDKGHIVSGIPAIDPTPPIPNFVLSILSDQNGDNGYVDPSETPRIPSKNIAGGLAFGANFSYNLDIDFMIFYCRIGFMAGFDLAFLQTNGLKCQQEDGSVIDVGVNGFYAKGQAYLGAKVDIGVDIDLFFFSGKISIVEAGIAAMVKFGAPNPSYLSGAIGGYFSVLGGIVSGRFAMKFYWGDECTELAPPQSIPLISEINPNAEFDEENYKAVVNVPHEVPIFTVPTVTFNYEVDRTFLIIVPAPDPDNKGEMYRLYRYYHILPSDITLRLSGDTITYNGVPYNRPLNISDFKLSPDKFSLIPKDDFSFNKNSTYYFDVTASVRIADLGVNSRQVSGGVIGYIDSDSEIKGVDNFNRSSWKKALAKNNKDTYIDERHLKFVTDCGIRYIENGWLTDLQPFHRSQNNPTSLTPLVRESHLRAAESQNLNLYVPLYNLPRANNRAAAPRLASTNYFASKNKLTLSINKDFFQTSKLCIPDDFEEDGFDFVFKISSFNKAASNASFKKEYIIVQPNDPKTSLSTQLNAALPASSYVIIQCLLKKRKGPNDSSPDFRSKQLQVNTRTGDVKLMNVDINSDSSFAVSTYSRSIPLESKLKTSSSEMEIFRWYFTTGEYNNYKEKMAAMDIEVDTATRTANFLEGNSSGSAFRTHHYKVNVATYKFYGNEKFDFHDVMDHSLSDVFEDASNRKYDKKLQDGVFGFAFDNKSQDLVNSFLRTYFNNQSLMSQYISHRDGTPMREDNPNLMFINNYITEKMLEATHWDAIKLHAEVLPPLQHLPANILDSNQSFMRSMLFGSKKLMFSIERQARVLSYEGSTSRVIPAHIISMKDVLSDFNNNGPIIIFSFMADMMTDFNTNVLPSVAAGFNPSFANNLKFKK